MRLPSKELQISDRVAVISIQPELIDPVRRSQFRIQPHRAGFGLPELHAGRGSDQRKYQTMRPRTAQPANQINSGENVSPLIAAAHLQSATMPVIENEVIVGLQQWIAELSKTNTFFVLQ